MGRKRVPRSERENPAEQREGGVSNTNTRTGRDRHRHRKRQRDAHESRSAADTIEMFAHPPAPADDAPGPRPHAGLHGDPRKRQHRWTFATVRCATVAPGLRRAPGWARSSRSADNGEDGWERDRLVNLQLPWNELRWRLSRTRTTVHNRVEYSGLHAQHSCHMVWGVAHKRGGYHELCRSHLHQHIEQARDTEVHAEQSIRQLRDDWRERISPPRPTRPWTRAPNTGWC